ncbi:aromatic ring-hydroxylating dioxygenase subunit alpha [Bradyrhizobium sp. 200]|uniref:aromatic ring-hydroxylating oxygenase subunit alpha n=1 Tax=Bradyrhizobium sp. 200 TaxID=2782665 RepID=UPI0020000AA2|nr:aromatic ring-hydroxylating dioxygenase subunit alpha [Bradyrhizobium sp. 200]UPJ48395.1 aromatic ring-hydroxylating dioxygenase subunit alpha [Bradyrhizobium sp. 200]
MNRHINQPQSYEEVLATDTRPVPDYIRKFGNKVEGPYEIPTRWYTDRSLFKDEVENIWKRKWQLACRTDHVAQKGDTYIYNVAGLSFVIVRLSDDVIKGYWNSCLHRGVPLRQCAGRVTRLQCPYHGFTWGLDGRSLLIPNPEDFPHINPEKFSLPEVQVAVWQDFVFINPDLGAEPFESYIGQLDSQLQRWPYSRRDVSIHVTKVFACNWKALQEAFMESFHVLTTHPQLAFSTAGDRCNDFSAFGNVSRGVLAIGQTSDYVPISPDEQYIYTRLNGLWDDEEVPAEMKLPRGTTARQAFAQRNRDVQRAKFGAIVDDACDAEAVDVHYYTIFPNFHPFGFISAPFVYRFLPFGDDPDKSVMEVMFLTPVPENQERKPPAEPIRLGENQEFVEVTQLGSFGSFISQDSSNLESIMRGLRSSQTKVANFGRTHEGKIRHFYSVYEKSMGLSAADEVAAIRSKSG